MNKSESKYAHTARRMDEAFFALLEKKDFDYITVKDICLMAGVNRSTFYLHYETIGDLLNEAAEYVNQKCFSGFKKELNTTMQDIENAALSDLILVRKDILIDYLSFIKQNRVLFKVRVTHPAITSQDNTYAKLFKTVLEPILDRFHYDKAQQQYISSFYINGMNAVVMRWIENDCAEPIEEMVKIMVKCALPDGNGVHLSGEAAGYARSRE